MDERGTILTIPIPAVTLTGRTTQIVPEVIATGDGAQMTIRIGEHGERTIIPGREVLRELIHALDTIGQRMRELELGESNS